MSAARIEARGPELAGVLARLEREGRRVLSVDIKRSGYVLTVGPRATTEGQPSESDTIRHSTARALPSPHAYPTTGKESLTAGAGRWVPKISVSFQMIGENLI